MAGEFPVSVTDGPLKIDANTLAYALARNECGARLGLKDVIDALGLTLTRELSGLMRSEVFKLRYAAYVRELKESGESFKLKARVQAEELLKTQWEIIHDKNAPASVRMQGIQNVVEWADLKPKKAGDAPILPAISITIDLGGDKEDRTTIDVTPPISTDANDTATPVMLK